MMKTCYVKKFFSFCNYRHIVAFIITAIICVLLMIYVDKPLALHIKYNINPDVEKFFKTITDLGLSGWWFAIAIGAYFGLMFCAGTTVDKAEFEKYTAQARSFVFMITSMAISSVAVTVLKVIIGRFRPRYLFNDGTFGFDMFNFHFAMNSFPSGHSQSIWAAMTALLFIYPRYGFLFIPVAVLVSASRAITTVHFLSDTIMGSFLGIIIAVIMRYYFEADGSKVKINTEQ